MNKIFIIFVFILSCNKVKETKMNEKIKAEEQTSYLDNVNYKNSLSKIKNEGNEYSYMVLYNYHAGKRYSDYDKFIPYAEIMAEKYNSKFACMTLYKLYLAKNNGNDFYFKDSVFLKLEEKEKNIVLRYLKKGKSMNYEGCIDILNDLKEKGIYKE